MYFFSDGSEEKFRSVQDSILSLWQTFSYFHVLMDKRWTESSPPDMVDPWSTNSEREHPWHQNSVGLYILSGEEEKEGDGGTWKRTTRCRYLSSRVSFVDSSFIPRLMYNSLHHGVIYRGINPRLSPTWILVTFYPWHQKTHKVVKSQCLLVCYTPLFGYLPLVSSTYGSSVPLTVLLTVYMFTYSSSWFSLYV